MRFVEYLKPVVSVIIIGAGNDVPSVADMAQILGWDITVADGRPLPYKKSALFILQRACIKT